METTALFPDIVGQGIAKKRLSFFLDGYNATGIISHLMFIAPKGCGKTTLAKAVAKSLKSHEDNSKPHKTFIEINCSTIRNVKQFFNQIVIPHVHQRECTVLFDEASELPKDVTMMLLSALNPNKDNRNSVTYEDYVADFDFRQQSFMFATTEAHQIFHALMDRCDRVDLEEYTYNQLGRIVKVNIGKEYSFGDGLLDEIAPVLRGNARAAQKMAGYITSYLGPKKRTNFSKADWNSLRETLGILPLGLNRTELMVLRTLEERGECSLTHLSAVTELSPQCLRRDFEMYLQKHHLMEIGTGGRAITKKGQKYLKNLEPKKTIRIKLPPSTRSMDNK